MLDAVRAALPADAAVFAAAVADWRVAIGTDSQDQEGRAGEPPALEFAENPDILATVARMDDGRPPLVVGFAAETDDVIAHATRQAGAQGLRLDRGQRRLARDRASWAAAENAVTLITAEGAETWPRMGKDRGGRRLARAHRRRAGRA